MALAALQSTSVFYRRILSQFPQDISLAFAYGSGVFKQAGSSQGQMRNNMLDFVFAVDDPITWHTMNLIENRKHYSFLKYLGPKQISSIQNEYGAGVYYNTLVPSEERLIKYGVISTDALTDDLLHWKTMYIAGRLHKPVRILVQKENAKLRAALVANLKSAVIASFLMLPESFSEEELFLNIAGLSYSGDFRMVIGEDKAKVSNIVKENMEHFRILYNNILQECPQVVYKPQQGKLEVRLEFRFKPFLCGFCPPGGISTIVKTSSITQSAKGIVTAGLMKTVSYSVKKLRKMLKGWRRKTP
ncbi:hypothetical protein PDJAM_G00119090 [Pangasius djambal]|uniref:Uncharacterized protein n=1 Tax=Pangasius djambal TaxID=1691987 RepID=A0ACC5Z8X2_9TELE|nr:hypothetical protein [Pangasius djambal]